MPVVTRTPEFDTWLKGLRDAQAVMRVLGDTGVYYKQAGDAVTLLWGGDKSTQSADIEKSKRIASNLED